MLDTDVVPLGPEDCAILALESPTVAGHTCKIVRLAADAPGVEEMRARVASRIAVAPALMRRLGGAEAEPWWEPDPRFDVERHVGPAPVDGPVERDELPVLVAALFAQRLERDRPLWRMDVVGIRGGGAALVWRIHHALADGTTSMRYARALLWDAAAEPAQPSAHDHPSHAADDARRRGHLAAFLRREFSRSRGASPFDGTIGTRRQVGFAAVPLGELHDAAKALAGATLNDAVLSCVAGGLRTWVEHNHGRLDDMRVRVPVSLHHEGDDASNHDSFFSCALPLHERDPVARLRAVHAATTARKADHDADRREALLGELSGLSPRLGRWVARLEESPRRFALSVSNVPGPHAAVSVHGAPVTALHSLAEIGEHHALRISAVSLAGSLCLGFCADPDLVAGVQGMADAVAADAAALIAAAPLT